MNQEVLTALKKRRSIRKFKPEQISDELLDLVLEAGTYAPTGMGKQSPIMVVIQDKETRDKVAALNAAVMNGKMDPFYGAPTVIVVFGNGESGNCVQDASSVMGNLLNAAYATGLGSCWIARAKESFETEEGKNLMKEWGIPEHYVGVANCILGYMDGDMPQAKPRKEDYMIKIK